LRAHLNLLTNMAQIGDK